MGIFHIFHAYVLFTGGSLNYYHDKQLYLSQIVT